MKTQTSTNPVIMKVCNELEQALFSLPSRDEGSIHLRLQIEEAVEIAYEIAYGRQAGGRILPFSPAHRAGEEPRER